MRERMKKERMKKTLICTFILVACIMIAIAPAFMIGILDEPTSGTIYKKEFTPRHTTTYMQPISSGKVTTIHRRRKITPDTYEFHIEHDGETNIIEVTKEVYESYSVGDYYESEE